MSDISTAIERVKALAEKREAGLQGDAAHIRRGGDDADVDEMRQYATVPGVSLSDLQAVLSALTTRLAPDRTERARDEIEELTRQAMWDVEVARTDTVSPVNGARAYTIVNFAGARIEFHGGEWDNRTGTDEAAAQATRINDLLMSVARKGVLAALTPATAPDRDAIVRLIVDYLYGQRETPEELADAILKLIKGEG